MTQNISGFGSVVTMKASVTFPAGVTLTEFADDLDPVGSDNIDIGEMAMNVNGDAAYWKRAVPIPFTISAMPGTPTQRNLQALFDANRPQRGRRLVNDIITFDIVYPNGNKTTLSGGIIVNGPTMPNLSGEGRLGGMEYSFAFQGVSR